MPGAGPVLATGFRKSPGHDDQDRQAPPRISARGHARADIPIVILSSAHAPQDRERSYDLEADHYITKPVGRDLLAGELKIIEALAGRSRN